MSSTANRMAQTTRVVVAIDFGTSRSGYAYAFVDDKDIKHNLQWPGSPSPYYKTLTEILYSPNKKVLGWGFMARRMLANLPREEARKHSLLQTFKMDLHTPGNHVSDPIRKLPNGQEFRVHNLIIDYLRLIKDVALTQVKNATGGQLRDDEVLWCLTVPAIWENHEKNIMRRAAHRAGLIEEHDSERLLLALEPEAAAIYCQENAQFQLNPGQRFMIVDCGGGTVDITAHEVSKNNDLIEMTNGTGGAYGSTFVDRSFKEYLAQKLGASVLSEFEQQNPLAFIELMETWERIKIDFGPSKNSANQASNMWRKLWVRKFQFGATFYKLLFQRCPEVLNALEEEQGADEYLELDAATMENIFSPVVSQIVSKVREELDLLEAENKSCDYLLMVGGFAESPLLQEIIRDEFTSSVGNIIVPSYPGAAIVQGAVAFGLNPYKIRSRRSRLTYGWRSMERFNSSKHPSEKREFMNDNYYCSSIFSKIVRAGDSVVVDDAVVKSVSPIFPDQTSILLDFYASVHPDVKYTDEPSVTKVGTMTVEMPDTTDGTDRKVEIKAYFGRTEIQVEATDLTTRNKAQVTLRFSSTFSSELLGS